MKKRVFLTISHLLFAAAGFALGLYVLLFLLHPKRPQLKQCQKHLKMYATPQSL